MALIKTMETDITYCLKSSITTSSEKVTSEININKRFENCYLKIGRISGTKDIIFFDLEIYTDDTKEELITIEPHRFKPNIEEGSPNFIKQAYEYLKTLNRFIDAIDC